ncbi:MAG: hypothetical protein JJ975_12695, partial [Bacteroidia bacterium]|nr:hypothetical protein [Bacteroidia bacterium]
VDSLKYNIYLVPHYSGYYTVKNATCNRVKEYDIEIYAHPDIELGDKITMERDNGRIQSYVIRANGTRVALASFADIHVDKPMVAEFYSIYKGNKFMIKLVEDHGYRFGFNGMEGDEEVKGKGGSYAFKYRIHDVRLGRFLSLDPLFRNYPWNSTYGFAENSVVGFIDVEGLERYYAADGRLLGKTGDDPTIRIVNDYYVDQTEQALNSLASGSVSKSDGIVLLRAKTKHSLLFHEAPEDAQRQVAARIFRNGINSKIGIKTLDIIKSNPESEILKGMTSAPGQFHLHATINLDGEFLFDNYYNLLSLWEHEEEHSKLRGINPGDGGDDPVRHFNIYMKQIRSETFKFTTDAYRESVFDGIRDQILSYEDDLYQRLVTGLQFTGDTPEVLDRMVENYSLMIKVYQDETGRKHESLDSNGNSEYDEIMKANKKRKTNEK